MVKDDTRCVHHQIAKQFVNSQPKTIICEAQAKKAEFVSKVFEKILMEKSKTAVQAKKSVR